MQARDECTNLFSPSSPILPPRRRTMEDIWKEIGLSGLEDQLSTRASKLGGINGSDRSSRAFLQEFLARPFREDQDQDHLGGSDLGSCPRHRGDHLSLPATALRLSSTPDRLPLLHGRIERREASLSDPFEAINSSLSRKRIMEVSTDISGDRRHQRMMKNRESAARSRARKQAYTNELEMEVAHLMEENARLRKKLLQQELLLLLHKHPPSVAFPDLRHPHSSQKVNKKNMSNKSIRSSSLRNLVNSNEGMEPRLLWLMTRTNKYLEESNLEIKNYSRVLLACPIFTRKTGVQPQYEIPEN